MKNFIKNSYNKSPIRSLIAVIGVLIIIIGLVTMLLYDTGIINGIINSVWHY